MTKPEIHDLIESIPNESFKPSKGQCKFWVNSVTTGTSTITPTEVELGDVYFIEQTKHPVIIIEKMSDNLFIVGHLSTSAKDMSYATVHSRFGKPMYVTAYGKIIKSMLIDFKYQLNEAAVLSIKKMMW